MSRPSQLDSYAFDLARFEALRQAFASGSLDLGGQRLATAPLAISPTGTGAPLRIVQSPREHAQEAQTVALRASGRAAIRAGRIGLVIMAGGMATRFGGGAKGAVPVLPDRPDSFLSMALGRVHRTALSCGGEIPTAVMTSFATSGAVDACLDEMQWAGLPVKLRHRFEQSILPRLLATAPHDPVWSAAPGLPVHLSCAAPGHGDTLTRLRTSGCLAAMQAQGVEHILVANVDNLGAQVDPVIVGAHLAASRLGSQVSVEVVARGATDRGGCVAQLASGRIAIVEAFRLPQSSSLGDYPHFNTNSLWFEAAAVSEPVPLDWFAVRKQVTTPSGDALEVVQFEQLIGQATEHLATALIEVPRALRFVPVKTREDLAAQAPAIAARLADSDAYLV